VGTPESHRPARLGQQEYIPQDAQKVQTSHPPDPCAPRRALSQARPQRAKRRRRTLRYVEPLSDARTKLADFFSILLDRLADLKYRRLIEIGAWRGFDRNLPIPVEHPTAVGASVEILRAFYF